MLTISLDPVCLHPNFKSDSDFFLLVDHIQTLSGASNPRFSSNITALVSGDDDVPESAERPAERPAKRAKTEPPENYIPIARRTLSFSRERSNVESSPRPINWLQSNGFFRLRYRKQEGLSISNQSRKLVRNCPQVTFPPEEVGELSDADMLILSIAEKSASLPSSVGRFWTAICFSVRTDRASNTVTLAIDFELRWMTAPHVSSDLHTAAEKSLRSLVVSTFFPIAERNNRIQARRLDKDTWTPHEFYEAAHATDKNDGEPDDLYVPGLTANLFPFQRRAVKWLLRREGVRWSPREATGAPHNTANGSEPLLVVPYQVSEDSESISHFTAAEDIDGEIFFMSELFGVATRHPSQYQAYENSIRGGILSEEMGLGKTVEMISLILLHARDTSPVDTQPGDLRPTGATLIVAPPALKNQWISEMKQHAPHLRVMVYAGMLRSCSSAEEEAKTIEQFASHDAVVTTYSDLKSELHFAMEPPERNMRSSVDKLQRYRPRSPLVQVSWWRVCLDEAQEIESGVSNTATVVRCVPRVNAWGVTGTPVKDGVQDLWGLLLFLRYEPFSSHQKVWKQLTQHHKREFRSLFGRIALRHSKRTVGDELVIPPQKRYVISMPFTAVEEQHYQSLFKQLANSCGLDTMGAPLTDIWEPDDPVILEAMRSALSRLRQTALHPEIGAHSNRVGHKARPMRTVEEVLSTMIDQSESALLTNRRALLLHRLKQGQLFENSPRVNSAIDIWQTVLTESKVLVKEARVKLEQAQKDAIEEDSTVNWLKNDGKRHRSATNTDVNEETFVDEDGQDNPLPGRVGEAQRDLRYALEILHKAEFFCANGLYQVKTNEDWTRPDSEEFKQVEKLEIEAYERAKLVRREILSENRSKAMQLMADLAGKAGTQGFVEIPEAQFAAPEGIEGRRISEELDHLAGLLSTQAAQMDEWREAVVRLLLKDLIDDDEDSMSGKAVEITGDEYEDSTKVQDEIQAYITILKAAVSDRNTLLTGQVPSGLALYEERQALRMAEHDEGPAPKLMLRLFAERRATMPNLSSGNDVVRSLRAAIIDLRDIATRLRGQHASGGSLNNITSQRAQMELACVTRQLASAQSEQTRQLKVSEALEKEAKKISNAMNTRIAYYRQLQAVSDMVALYEGPKDDATIAALAREESDLVQGLARTESKYRYLLHLRDAEFSAEESHLCVICQSTFLTGVLTVCGHQFCKECITLWFRAHHNCPVCKRKLTLNNLHDITLKAQSLKIIDEHGGGRQQGGQSQTEEQRARESPQQQMQLPEVKNANIYARFSTEKLEEIKNIDLPGPSFTTKVDTIVRHLMWLRSTDAGAKSIVFSQYPAFLMILTEAFHRYRIAFSRYTDRNGIENFKDDPSIECFLLHARAHSSGLNLVNASHVLLCEPLLNTALELQAIARVHRIGQKHETTVWLYIVDGTVEESIYNLSVRRRLAHMERQCRSTAINAHDSDAGNEKGKGKNRSNVKGHGETPIAESLTSEPLLDNNLELANSFELQQAQLSKLMGKGKMSGEEVDKSDLWTCLFGNASNAAANELRLQNDLVVRRHLTATAAAERQEGAVNFTHTLTPPTYAEVLRTDRLLEDKWRDIPAFMKVRPLDDCVAEPPMKIVQRFGLASLYQKSRCVLHCPHLVDAVPLPEHAYSRRTCLHSALSLLAYHEAIHTATQPGGLLHHIGWFVTGLGMHDILLASMVVYLVVQNDSLFDAELVTSSRKSGVTTTTNKGTEANDPRLHRDEDQMSLDGRTGNGPSNSSGTFTAYLSSTVTLPADRKTLIDLLRRVYDIWADDSEKNDGTTKAADLLNILLRKIHARGMR
ncbi:hypothetical protein SEPCBS57363_005427 [Sporothrix epigloea]|uniref:Uncharacterized protein n=1 Tax=Sporothrix epigloea TaxID=1892477 RepID=A0ABP0DXJ3_9PEZI